MSDTIKASELVERIVDESKGDLRLLDNVLQLLGARLRRLYIMRLLTKE